MSTHSDQPLHHIEQAPSHCFSLEQILPLVDLTLLNLQATPEEIIQLSKAAHTQHVAAVCVFPQHLQYVKANIPRATVVNFPGGNHDHQQILHDMEHAIMDHQADEIDYVFAYPLYLAGQQAEALSRCREAYRLCHSQGRLFKVILETGALPSTDMIYQLSQEVIHAGCDMLKTSTGKISVGATLPAVFAMLNAIHDLQSTCGIKCSGGIKTTEQASRFIHLSQQVLGKPVDKTWFRIGASAIQSS